jgi:hypothetical protein
MPKLLFHGEDITKTAFHLPQSKKQRECIHDWDYVFEKLGGGDSERLRAFCHKCRFHFQRSSEQVVRWGPWEKLPDTGPKFTKYLKDRKVILAHWDKQPLPGDIACDRSRVLEKGFKKAYGKKSK